MKKCWVIVSVLAAVVWLVVVAWAIAPNGNLQFPRQKAQEESVSNHDERINLPSWITEERPIVVSTDEEPKEDSPETEDGDDIDGSVPAPESEPESDPGQEPELSLIDMGYAERIRSMMSADEMVVLGVYPVGEDSAESMKRFFLCDGRYHAEFYLADYITGEIVNLSDRNLGIDVSYYYDRDEAGQSITAYYGWEIQIEDYDGNGEPDILLVLSFPEKGSGFSRTGGVLLWLQKQGSFLPVNRNCCGYYSRWRESEFSVKIAELEEKFREEQNPDSWSIDRVSTWVREELLEGQTENLNKILENPREQIPYDQRRESRELYPELVQDTQGHYSVRIEGNPYGEKRINEWLKDFYERDEEEENKFMGVTREDEETMTQQERIDAEFYYNTSVWSERVDDAVVCLMTSTYAYSGGVHGNDMTYAVVFDTRSGEVLRIEDVVVSRERFFDFVLDYIETNEELASWETEDMKESLRDERWCFTDYGFKVFWNGMNGAGIYSCEVPYELLIDYLKEEYLPISRAAKQGIYYWEYNQTEGKILMDVNADGEVDTLIISAPEEKPIQLSVNATVSELDPKYRDKPISGQQVRIRSVVLERQEDGTTKLNLKVSIRSSEEEKSHWRVYVYRFEEECAILETEYEVEEEY